jgi:hypothetical protein
MNGHSERTPGPWAVTRDILAEALNSHAVWRLPSELLVCHLQSPLLSREAMSTSENDKRARTAADQIIGGMKMGKSPEQAAADLISMGVPENLVEAGLARVRQRAEESRILRIPETLVDLASLSGPWYPGVTLGDRFWPALEDEFKHSGLPHSAIDSIDNASRKIVSLLAPPWEKEIRTRGLVLGYVQSGKTSNFTAVVANPAISRGR